MGLKERVEKVVKMAEEKVEKEGGTFEGWLWYLLKPPAFFLEKDKIVIEYPSEDLTFILRVIIDRKTHKVEVEEEEGDLDPL